LICILASGKSDKDFINNIKPDRKTSSRISLKKSKEIKILEIEIKLIIINNIDEINK
jgi:hypothetical protein